MAGAKQGSCPHAFMKQGAVHCRVELKRGARWDFCGHQYFCAVSGSYKLNEQALKCPLRNIKEEE